MTDHAETDKAIDPDAPILPEEDAAHAEPTPLHAPPLHGSHRLGVAPLIYVAGFVVLALALLWIWRHPARMQADLTPQPQTATATPPVPAATLASAAALAQTNAQLQAMQAEILRLHQAPPAPAAPVAPTDLLQKLDSAAQSQAAMGQNLAALETRVQGMEAAANARIDAAQTRLAALEHEAGENAARAAAAARLAQLLAAGAALEAGQMVPASAVLPSALQPYTISAPPTLAGLRLGFANAVAVTEAFPPATPTGQAVPAEDTQAETTQTGWRRWAAQGLLAVQRRVGDVVTIRQGTHVLVGDPEAGILAAAQDALAAGDLPGAVAALAPLNGHAVPAMAAWLAQARGLLGAQVALRAAQLQASQAIAANGNQP